MRQHFVRDFIVGCAYLVLIAALIAVSIMVYRKDFTSTMDVGLQRARRRHASCRPAPTSRCAAWSIGSVHSITSTGTAPEHQPRARPDPGRTAARQRHRPAAAQDAVRPALRRARAARHPEPRPPDERRHDHRRGHLGHRHRTAGRVRATCCGCCRRCVPPSWRRPWAPSRRRCATRAPRSARRSTSWRATCTSSHPKVPRMADDISASPRSRTPTADAAPDLLQSLRNFTVTNQTLVAERGQFVDLLHSVTDASNRFAGFTETNSRNLIHALALQPRRRCRCWPGTRASSRA